MFRRNHGGHASESFPGLTSLIEAREKEGSGFYDTPANIFDEFAAIARDGNGGLRADLFGQHDESGRAIFAAFDDGERFLSEAMHWAKQQAAETGKQPAGNDGRSGDQEAIRSLLSVFTNGIVDERIDRAARVLQDNSLSANEKLTKIDALMKFPATASAEALGQLVCVSKQAVMKGDWWIENRKGEKANEIGRRHDKHGESAKRREQDQN